MNLDILQMFQVTDSFLVDAAAHELSDDFDAVELGRNYFSTYGCLNILHRSFQARLQMVFIKCYWRSSRHWATGRKRAGQLEERQQLPFAGVPGKLFHILNPKITPFI